MPQIKILDRHKVTQLERTKATALVDIPKVKKNGAKKMLTDKEKEMKGFSAGEKDLYAEVDAINRAIDAKNQAEMEKTRAVRDC